MTTLSEPDALTVLEWNRRRELHAHRLEILNASEPKQPEDSARFIDPQRTIDAVCDYFHVTREDLFGEGKFVMITVPRQLAMWLLRKYTLMSLELIGRLFRRGHTTIMHGINSTVRRIREDPTMRRHVRTIESREPFAAKA